MSMASKLSRRKFLGTGALVAGATLAGGELLLTWKGQGVVSAVAGSSPTLAKFVDALPIPDLMPQAAPNYYQVAMTQFRQKLHRDLPATTLWGYGGTFPGRTFDVRRGTPITVRWDNNLPTQHLLAKSIDPTVPDPSTKTLPKVRNVVHLHGGFSLPQFDGHPDAWYTPGMTQTGTHFVSNAYTYGNDQQATALWYHDHANAITRLNVYTGLVGMYLIRDEVEDRLNLPRGRFEVPLILSDKTFNRDGSLFYATQGVTTSHPVWVPEFFGDTALVNGKVHPYLEVEPRRYRFRLLNASNARFYHLTIETKTPQPFYQIGSDGGFMPAPVRLTDVLVAPAERLDLIVDFSRFTPGTVLTMRNDANAPYPGGGGGDAIPEIMQFRVTRPLSSPDTSAAPEALTGSALPAMAALAPGAATRRQIVVYEWDDDVTGNPIRSLLNGKYFEDPVSDFVQAGGTEIWEFVNLTPDVHPLHVHLVEFQVLNRQPINEDAFTQAWLAGQDPQVSDYLLGGPTPPDSNERGPKDTVKTYPGMVTRIIARFDMPTYGQVVLPRNTTGPQYIYHCHILEHEDNEMMRPFQVNV